MWKDEEVKEMMLSQNIKSRSVFFLYKIKKKIERQCNKWITFLYLQTQIDLT